MKWWSRAVVAVLMTSFALPAAAATDAPEPTPEDVITWGVVPAASDGSADGRISYRHVVEPGATIHEHALVTNYSERPVTFALDGAPGVISEDGTFDVLDPDDPAVDDDSWISIQETVDVPAASAVAVPFTVDVPEDAVPGDHPGGIVVGIADDTASGDALAVGLDARTGLRIHLRVAGDIMPRLEVRDLRATYEPSWNPFSPGRLTIDYTVANAGNVRLASAESARLAGLLGIGARTVDDDAMEPAETLPAGGKSVSVTLDDVWPLGRLTSTVTAAPAVVGEDDLGSAPLDLATAEATAWALPWAQLLLLCVAVGLVLLARRRRRRRRAAYEAALAAARQEGAMRTVEAETSPPRTDDDRPATSHDRA